MVAWDGYSEVGCFWIYYLGKVERIGWLMDLDAEWERNKSQRWLSSWKKGVVIN